MKQFRFALAALFCGALAFTGSPAPVTLADNAPGYETPEGLAIGLPNPTVRMLGEQVDVKVVERGSTAIGLVTATFNMLNDGSTLQLLTGFPNVYTVDDGFDSRSGSSGI